MTDSLQMLVTNLDYDEHKGRIAIGRITSGHLVKGETVAIAKPGTAPLAHSQGAKDDACYPLLWQPGTSCKVWPQFIPGKHVSHVRQVLERQKQFSDALVHTPAEVEKPRTGKLAELFVYNNFSRMPVERVEAGDICAITGLSDVMIGETLCNPQDIRPLPSIAVRISPEQANPYQDHTS